MKACYLLPLALLVAPQAFAGGYTHADVCKAVIVVEHGYALERLRITHGGETPEILFIHKQNRERTRFRCQFPGNEHVQLSSYVDDKKAPGRWLEGGSATYLEQGTHLTVKTAKGASREFITRDFRQ